MVGFAASFYGEGFAGKFERWRSSLFLCLLISIAKFDRVGGTRGQIAGEFVLTANLDGLAERGDLDLADAVAFEANKAHGLGLMAVDPLFVAGAVFATLAQLALGLAECGEDHAVVHADEHFVGVDGAFDGSWKGFRVGDFTGFGAEIDDRLE